MTHNETTQCFFLILLFLGLMIFGSNHDDPRREIESNLSSSEDLILIKIKETNSADFFDARVYFSNSSNIYGIYTREATSDIVLLALKNIPRWDTDAYYSGPSFLEDVYIPNQQEILKMRIVHKSGCLQGNVILHDPDDLSGSCTITLEAFTTTGSSHYFKIRSSNEYSTLSELKEKLKDVYFY